jgi:hypothetical protein
MHPANKDALLTTNVVPTSSFGTPSAASFFFFDGVLRIGSTASVGIQATATNNNNNSGGDNLMGFSNISQGAIVSVLVVVSLCTVWPQTQVCSHGAQCTRSPGNEFNSNR